MIAPTAMQGHAEEVEEGQGVAMITTLAEVFPKLCAQLQVEAETRGVPAWTLVEEYTRKMYSTAGLPSPSDEAIAHAVECVRKGEIVPPTKTVKVSP